MVLKNTRAAPALLRIGEAEMQQSGHFTRLIRDSSLRDYLNLFKFRSFEAKKSRHLEDLIRTYEIRGLSAESVYTRRKLAALHCLRDVQTKAAYTSRRVKQTEFANNHFHFPFCSPWFALNNMSVSYDPARAPDGGVALRPNGSAASYE